jgi:plastocyanin
MLDNKFEFDGEENPAITVTAGSETTFTLTNKGAALHNLHVDGTNNTYPVDFCAPDDGESTACSDPARIPGGRTGTLTMTLEAGTYNFRCDFHPTEMTGTFVVE